MLNLFSEKLTWFLKLMGSQWKCHTVQAFCDSTAAMGEINVMCGMCLCIILVIVLTVWRVVLHFIA